MFPCPKCAHKTWTLESRFKREPSGKATQIRKRECKNPKCQEKFKTIEVLL